MHWFAKTAELIGRCQHRSLNGVECPELGKNLKEARE
jgi:hypothetical protein